MQLSCVSEVQITRKPRATAEVKTTVAVERDATNGDAPVESKKEQ